MKATTRNLPFIYFIISILAVQMICNEQKEDYTNMTNEEIMELSEECGKLRFNAEECYENFNCMFVEHYIDKFQESMPFCLSFDEMMRYYIKDDQVFLKSRKFKSHKFVNRDNICDIFQLLDAPFGFLNIEGKVLACHIKLE